MTRLGLEVIQDRKTNRQVRHILPQDKSDTTVLAELAVDAVAFHFGKKVVRLHEIEIESKTKGRNAGLGILVKKLKSMYKPALKTWESKLATGNAIGELLVKGEIQELLTKDKSLKPAAYDKIDRYLRNELKKTLI